MRYSYVRSDLLLVVPCAVMLRCHIPATLYSTVQAINSKLHYDKMFTG